MTAFCPWCQQRLPESDQPTLSIVGAQPAPAHTKSRAADPVTAKTAARLAVVRQGSQRYRLLAALERAGVSGLTAEQCAEQTGIAYVSSSTRLTELVRGGLVERTGHTRPTSSGTQADVLVVTQAGRDELVRVRAEQAAA